MTEADAEFLESFERCTLPRDQWHHKSHVRVAFLYASRFELDTAIECMRRGIKAYNAATDTPEAIDRGYHETMTLAFMRLIHAAVSQHGPYASSDDFCDRHAELLDKHVLRQFYSAERIMTWDAKARFVEPDFAPLPGATRK